MKPVAGKLGRLLLVGCALAAYGPGALADPQQAGAGKKRSVKPTPRKKWTLKGLKAPFQKPWWAAKKPQERKPELPPPAAQGLDLDDAGVEEEAAGG